MTMSTTDVEIGVVLLFGVATGVLAAAWMRRRLGIASIGVFVVASSVWVGAVAAITSGYRGADGFAGCADSCTGVHYVSALGFLTPPLLISLASLGMLVAMAGRWRSRRRAAREPRA
jgi:hypothetical protein